MATETENKATEKYLKKVSKELLNLEENIMAEEEFIKDKTEVFNSDKEARTDARLQAIIKGEPFDETETPTEELTTVEEDIITRIVERKLDLILGD